MCHIAPVKFYPRHPMFRTAVVLEDYLGSGLMGGSRGLLSNIERGGFLCVVVSTAGSNPDSSSYVISWTNTHS